MLLDSRLTDEKFLLGAVDLANLVLVTRANYRFLLLESSLTEVEGTECLRTLHPDLDSSHRTDAGIVVRAVVGSSCANSLCTGRRRHGFESAVRLLIAKAQACRTEMGASVGLWSVKRGEKRGSQPKGARG